MVVKAAAASAFMLLVFSSLGLAGAQTTKPSFQPFVLFHGGARSNPNGDSCSDFNWDLFTTRLYSKFNTTRRNLSNGHQQHSPTASTTHFRTMNSPKRLLRRGVGSAICINRLVSFARAACAGYATRRRTLQLSTTKTTTATSTCDPVQLKHFNDTINAIVPTINSGSCRRYLSTGRNVLCRPLVSCHIQYFNLWDADAGIELVHGLNATGSKICNTINAGFQPELDYDVGTLYFNMTGPVSFSRDETVPPYFVEGNDGADVKGTVYKVGHYTLSAYSSNAPDLVTTMSFEVIKC